MCLLVAYSYQVWFLPINVGFIVIEMFWLMYVAVVYTVRPLMRTPSHAHMRTL